MRWALLLTLFAAIDGHLSFGASKTHLDEASQWINASTRASSTLITNEIHIAYQSGRVEHYDEVRREMPAGVISAAAPGTIIAVTPRRSFQAELDSGLANGSLRLIREFPAERGANLLVLEKEL